MSNNDHKSYKICAQSHRSFGCELRTPSASMSVFFFISISCVVCVRTYGWHRTYQIYLLVYFIGFIEYQGQIFALKSNILKYSTLRSTLLGYKSLCAQFSHQREYSRISLSLRIMYIVLGTLYVSSDTQRITVNFVVSSRRPIERKLRAHRKWFLVSILAYFLPFAWYVCALSTHVKCHNEWDCTRKANVRICEMFSVSNRILCAKWMSHSNTRAAYIYGRLFAAHTPHSTRAWIQRLLYITIIIFVVARFMFADP